MKKFLENNKIYFETIAATCIGIMAIIVSVSQALVAYRTLNLDKLRYMPEITASIVIDKSGSSVKFVGELWLRKLAKRMI